MEKVEKFFAANARLRCCRDVCTALGTMENLIKKEIELKSKLKVFSNFFECLMGKFVNEKNIN